MCTAVRSSDLMRFSITHITDVTYNEEDGEWVIMSTGRLPRVKRKAVSEAEVERVKGNLKATGNMPKFSTFDKVMEQVFVRMVVESDGSITVQIPQWIKVHLHGLLDLSGTYFGPFETKLNELGFESDSKE